MYNHAPDNYICPFCLLVQGIENEHIHSVQSDTIYHDNAVTAFIGSHQWPNNHGNVIIVPNEHFENIYDLPIHYAVEIHRVARIMALTMKVAYSCDGISTRQHNEPAGNQDVWHYHVHVTPRYQDDQFYSTRRELMPVAQRAMLAEELESCLKQMEYTATETSSHGRDEEPQWVRFLSSGDPVKGMALVLIQKMCTAFHEFEPAWRAGALAEQQLPFFRERLTGRIERVVTMMRANK